MRPIYYHLSDHLNSTQATLDQSGAITELSDYYAFGNQRLDMQAAGSSFSEPRKYIGQYQDATTNLDYLNARYYNSAYGRFLSEDPVFWSQNQNLRDPQSLNAYSYANNNPIRLSDPSGKYWELSASGTLPLVPGINWGVNGSVGIAFSWRGLNLTYSGGFGWGVSGKPLAVSYNPGEDVPHTKETSPVVGGSFVPGFGLNVEGQQDPNYSSIKIDKKMSFVIGAGFDAYTAIKTSLPLIGGTPINAVPGPSYLCSPNNIIQPIQNSALMISSPTIAGAANSQTQNYTYSSLRTNNLVQQVAILQQIISLQYQVNQLKSNTK